MPALTPVREYRLGALNLLATSKARYGSLFEYELMFGPATSRVSRALTYRDPIDGCVLLVVCEAEEDLTDEY